MTTWIRPAQPDDAPAASELIALSMHAMGVALFGMGDPARQQAVLSSLFRRRDNRFSFAWSWIAEWEGQTAGLLLAYPGELQFRLNLGLFWQILPLYGVKNGLRFIAAATTLASYKEVDAGDLLVSNLAVYPGFEGRGIGQSLLAQAEAIACARGIRQLALIVDLDNPRARRLYERQGYRVEATYPTPHMAARLGTRGFERMLKEVSRGEPV